MPVPNRRVTFGVILKNNLEQGTSMIKKKICLIGSFAVGKTSLLGRFVHNRFDDKYLTTIGMKISKKTLPPVQDPISGSVVQYAFLIWDIAGMEKFDTLAMNYYRSASGALAVADLTRRETIPRLQDICDRFRSVSPGAQLLIIGNKLDIFQQDRETMILLKKTVSNLSAEYLLTSAKTGQGVEQAFLQLAKRIG